MRAALAHGRDAPHTAHAGWPLESWLVLPLLVVAMLYLSGSTRTRRAPWRATLFWLGLGTLALALVSPLHEAAERLFTLHMIEHELLMVVAAPLLVASRPGGVLLWGLPGAARRPLVAAIQHPWTRATWRGASELWSATALHAIALWVWHLPSLFQAATTHSGIHVLQHVSFLASALLLWHAALQPRVRGQAVLALFLTSLQAGLLGSLLTVSRTLWYPDAPDPFPEFGLTRAEDQALAGLVMWIPACSVYALAALALMGRWLAQLGAARRA